MIFAGEPSGDAVAAQLVAALREESAAEGPDYSNDFQPLRASIEPRFFGAGGPLMDAAGVELAFDMTEHAVVGIAEPLKKYFQFRRLFNQLYRLALERQPDVIIGVDFSWFNSHFARVARRYVRSRRDWFHDWQPKIVRYVSPQVWASREGRAYDVARDYDLLLSIFPFEKEWYARRVPRLRVEFVGHPMLDRFQGMERRKPEISEGHPLILLLPGSRRDELRRHLPVLADAVKRIRSALPDARACIVLPNEPLAEQARALGLPPQTELQVGSLPTALARADLALAKSGTVTMECACFGVPTVTLYKASRISYEIAKRLVNVDSIIMPNLLANEEVFPEFIQDAATAGNISRAALELLTNGARRRSVKAKLSAIVDSLGGPGASRRAARAILDLAQARQRGQ